MAMNFTSNVKPTSFSLHPETVERLRLGAAHVSKKTGNTITMSRFVERAVHRLLDEQGIRMVRTAPAKTAKKAVAKK